MAVASTRGGSSDESKEHLLHHLAVLDRLLCHVIISSTVGTRDLVPTDMRASCCQETKGCWMRDVMIAVLSRGLESPGEAKFMFSLS